MNIFSKLDRLAYELSKTEQVMEKATQISRTKAEIQKSIKEEIGRVAEVRESIARYRNTIQSPIELGEEKNSLYDEMIAIREQIGTAQYLLANGKTEEASEALCRITKAISGREV